MAGFKEADFVSTGDQNVDQIQRNLTESMASAIEKSILDGVVLEVSLSNTTENKIKHPLKRAVTGYLIIGSDANIEVPARTPSFDETRVLVLSPASAAANVSLLVW